MRGYGADLAYIHDAGHSDYAWQAAAGRLRLLREHGVSGGLIADLGCGSGRLARELNRAGYRVLGIDQSPEMIRLARRIAPGSRFRVASFLDADLPACDAITSIGECLNYCFDEKNSRSELRRFFKRVFRALRPGGVFICDVAGPARRPGKNARQYWSAGPDWAVMSSTTADGETLRRQITCFRKLGPFYRRSEEVHELRLYRASDLVEDLLQCGFRARTLAGYGRFRLPRGIAGILAVRPAPANSRWLCP